MNIRNLILLALSFVFILPIASFAEEQEEIVLTTYYPAPYGDYDELIANSLLVAEQVKIQDGTEGAGKVLTSDADGVGTWQAPQASSFGSIVDKACDTPYLAETDGFVMAIPGNDGTNYWSYLHGQISDSVSGPWTTISHGHGYTPSGGKGSITMPVKKGVYWQIVTAYGVPALAVHWMAVGD